MTTDEAPPISPQQFIDLHQAARDYSISKQTLRRWIRAGRLPAFWPFAARKFLVRRVDIQALLDAARVVPAADAGGR
jgi:excisionase family DNA binding protein